MQALHSVPRRGGGSQSLHQQTIYAQLQQCAMRAITAQECSGLNMSKRVRIYSVGQYRANLLLNDSKI